MTAQRTTLLSLCFLMLTLHFGIENTDHVKMIGVDVEVKFWWADWSLFTLILLNAISYGVRYYAYKKSQVTLSIREESAMHSAIQHNARRAALVAEYRAANEMENRREWIFDFWFPMAAALLATGVSLTTDLISLVSLIWANL